MGSEWRLLFNQPSSVALRPGVEMRPSWIGRAGGVDNSEVALLPDWLKGLKRGMESKQAVEIKDGTSGDIDAGPHRVIGLFTMRDDDI